MRMTMQLLVVCTALLPLYQAKTQAQENRAEKPVVRIYDVSDILATHEHKLGDWLGGDPFNSSGTVGGMQNFGGLGGGMGGGGMGTGGGGFGGGGNSGGMFSIPSNIQPQFGGGGFGGQTGGFGGGAIGGMGIGSGGGPASPDFGTLISVITETIDPENWSSMGGANSISSYPGPRLVVRCPEATHQELGGFLEELKESLTNSPTLEVSLRVVELPKEMLVALDAINAESMNQLAGADDAIRVTLRCANRQVATVAAGQRRSFVISATPVVGSNGLGGAGDNEKSIGYSPVVITPTIGVIGKVHPTVDADKDGPARTARIGLGMVVALQGEEASSSTFGSGQTIDRIDLSAAEFETTLDVVENQWTLAGLSATNSGQGLGRSHVALLVRWHQAK